MTLWSLHGRLWPAVSATWHSVCPGGSCSGCSLCFSQFSFFEWGFLYKWAKKRLLLNKPVCSLSLRLFFQLHKDALAGEWPGTPDQRGKQEEENLQEGDDVLFFCCCLLARTDFVIAIRKWWVPQNSSLMGKSPMGVASNCCCGHGSLTCTLGTMRRDSKGEPPAHAED